jgi:hypothetical protein
MKKLVKLLLITVLGLVVIGGGVVGYYYNKLSNLPFETIIRAKVKKHGEEQVTNWLADKYLKYGSFNAKGTVKGSPIPYFNYSLFMYQPRYHTQNQRVFYVAQLLLDQGADINAVDSKTGSTALHEAIQQTHPEVIEFLIKNNADPTIKINRPGKPWHGMDCSQYARYWAEALKGKVDYTQIIATIDKYTKEYTEKNKSNSKQ